MNIIIVGATQVGLTLAESLVLEENDVTLIDKNAAALHKIESKLDVLESTSTDSQYQIAKFLKSNMAVNDAIYLNIHSQKPHNPSIYWL